jgi:hypothetical protein
VITVEETVMVTVEEAEEEAEVEVAGSITIRNDIEV